MPQSPQTIRPHLQRLAPALRTIGIQIILGQREPRTGQGLITIKKVADAIVTVVTPVTAFSGSDQLERAESVLGEVGDKGDAGDKQIQGLSSPGYPPLIGGLGPLRRDALGRCTDCDELTSFSYGRVRLCTAHARFRAQVHREGNASSPQSSGSKS